MIIEIGGLKVPFPDQPPKEKIKNFGLHISKQKYKPTVVPKDIANWTPMKIDAYVKEQWRRREEGEWWFIKGLPFYIPGPALLFFDFWTTQGGKRPAFRIEALEFFQVWYLYVEPNPNVLGLFDLKVRRVGDTEKIMFIMWEAITRFKNVNGGLQSYTDLEANKNFRRLVKGHNGVPFFFKPRHSGSDKEALAFMKPSEAMTLKKLRDQAGKIDTTNESEEFNNSYIDFEATATGKYDGQQLFRYHLDEVFKIKPHQMNIKEQWDNVYQVLTLNNGKTIYGKAILSSTVEEKGNEDTSTVEVAQDLWDGSDPEDLDDNGRTKTGLVRIFRGYELGADVDEFGFHLVEEAKTFRDNELKSALDSGDYVKVLSIYRKKASTPEEALSISGADCPLFPELCTIRLNQLRLGLDRFDNEIKDYTPKISSYDLVWQNGIRGSKVLRIPNPNGHWHFSQDCINPNAIETKHVSNKLYTGRTYIPKNMQFYRMGCDPYDAMATVGKGSDGAFSVKRRYSPIHEEGLMFGPNGEILNPEVMITDTYVCDYKHRHKNPYDFYDDVVKTCFYFGVSVFPETNKSGISTWMIQNGFYGMLMFEPNQVMAPTRNKAQQGAPAGDRVISLYVDLLKQYVSTRIWNNHHPEIIKQWARFTVSKRTKFDLTVATGYTELADMDQRYVEAANNGWTTSIYHTYDG